jgi:hypothetical protein
MTKPISKQKRGRCIFCGQMGNRTKTHIWPEWLKSILSDTTHRVQTNIDHIHLSVDETDNPKQSRTLQGGMFSQKPYLACQKCNTGWMNDFEQQVLIFAKSLFTSSKETKLTRTQVRSLCGWLSLIAILAEYNVRREKSSIPKIDRHYIEEHLEPPKDWSIFARSQNNPELTPFYSTIKKWYEPNLQFHEHAAALVQGKDNFDTQLSIFGLGLIVVELFTSTHMRLVDDFRIYARSQGFVQLWPPPFIFNFLSSRSVSFPTKAPLDTSDVIDLHNAYSAHFEALFGAGKVSRFRHS